MVTFSKLVIIKHSQYYKIFLTSAIKTDRLRNVTNSVKAKNNSLNRINRTKNKEYRDLYFLFVIKCLPFSYAQLMHSHLTLYTLNQTLNLCCCRTTPFTEATNQDQILFPSDLGKLVMLSYHAS